MKAIRMLLLGLCAGLAACAPAVPAKATAAAPAKTGPRFEIDPQGVIAALQRNATGQQVASLDALSGYDLNNPPPDCFEPCTIPERRRSPPTRPC